MALADLVAVMRRATDQFEIAAEAARKLEKAMSDHDLFDPIIEQPYGWHASHKVRVAVKAHSHDHECEACGHTDDVATWGELEKPCPAARGFAQ